jgi:hypothetical protein
MAFLFVRFMLCLVHEVAYLKDGDHRQEPAKQEEEYKKQPE